MELLINQEYIMKVVPDYYDPNLLSGKGTLEEQICEYERDRVQKDDLYLIDVKKGKTTVTIIPEVSGWCGDEKKHSKHSFIGDRNVRYKCKGEAPTAMDMLSEILVEDK